MLRDNLYEQALRMAVDKNLRDVATLLQWVAGEADPSDRAFHVSRAIALLQDVHAQLAEQAQPRLGA